MSITKKIQDDISNEYNVKLLDNTFFNHKLHNTEIITSDLFNNFFSNIVYDIETVNQSIYSISNIIDTNYKSLYSMYDSIKLSINKTQSMINDASLYNSVLFSNINIVSEDFSNTNDISQNTLYVDVFNKYLSLKVDSIKNIDINNIGISNESNGKSNLDESYIYTNPNTYYLYEKDGNNDILKLNMIITMSNLDIINRLSITPYNFDTENWLRIVDISTSINGIDFISIYDNSNIYRKYLYNNIDGYKNIILDPSKNNNSNNYIFNFQPTKAKYISISIVQDRIHPILDKYMIGIQDISLYNVKYVNSGNITITKKIPKSHIKSLTLHTDSVSIINSSILNTKYEVSIDNTKWHNINPIENKSDENNILHFNEEWNDSSLQNNIESSNLSLKISMDKNNNPNQLYDVSFSESTMDSVSFPDSLPYNIQLSKTPISNTIRTIVTPFLRVGNDNSTNSIVVGKTEPDVYYYKIKTPFDIDGSVKLYIDDYVAKRFDDKKSILDSNLIGYYYSNNYIHLYIPDKPQYVHHTYREPWIIYDDESNSYDLSKLNTSIKRHKYEDEIKKQELNNTVNDNNSFSLKLRDGKDIRLTILPYNISTKTNTFKLNYISDGIKENINIIKRKINTDGSVAKETITDIIPANTTRIHLTGKPIIYDDTHTESSPNNPHIIGGYMVDYIDGFKEFIDSNEYAFSIDVDSKILYLRDSYKYDISIEYDRYVEYDLSTNDFSIGPDMQTITINPDIFDSSMIYSISYNMSVEIPKDSYTIDYNNESITLFDSDILSIYNDLSVYKDKNISVLYKYNIDFSDILYEIIDYISPILDKVSIFYTV